VEEQHNNKLMKSEQLPTFACIVGSRLCTERQRWDPPTKSQTSTHEGNCWVGVEERGGAVQHSAPWQGT
jgi:hypothetical protein